MNAMDIFYTIVAPVQVKLLIIALLFGVLIDVVRNCKRRQHVLFRWRSRLRSLLKKIVTFRTLRDQQTTNEDYTDSRSIYRNAIALEVT